MKKSLTVVIVILCLYLAYRYLLPYAFVSMGRGPISSDTLSVEDVLIEKSVKNYDGEQVSADINNKFVTFLVKTSVPSTEFDVYEFQLVKEVAPSIGMEQNIGDNLSDNYYFWSMQSETENSSYFSMSFQVPDKEIKGYLFYWGVYFGPYDFGS